MGETINTRVSIVKNGVKLEYTGRVTFELVYYPKERQQESS